MTHVDHAWRHRPKALGGTDPLEFTSGGVFTTYRGCVTARPSLQYLYALDDEVGSTVAADTADTNDATRIAGAAGGYPIFGAVGVFTGLPDETSCAFSNAGAGFPGNACRFEFNHPSSFFGLTSHWTIEMYYYPNSNGGRLFESWNGSIGEWTFIDSNGSGNLSAQRGAAVVGGTAAENAPIAEWTLVRVTYDGATLKIFVNDMDTPTDTDATATSLAGATIAAFGNARNTGGTGYDVIDGNLAYVSIYNEAITGSCAASGAGGTTNAPSGYAPVADGSGGVDWTDVATQTELDAHVDDTSAAHAATAISILDAAADFTATDVEGALAELQTADEADEAALAAHLADTVDAHDASAVSIVDAGGYFTGIEVEAALQELGASSGGGSAGRWEIVMEDGITSPPVPVTNEAEDDWLYVLVED